MNGLRWAAWVFAASGLAVLAVLLMVTRAALQAESREASIRAESASQDRLRLALWRMEGVLAPVVAREVARPYFHYQAFYPAERAYTRMLQEVRPGEVLVPSPLLTGADAFVRLHFQRGPDGRLTSPQAPEGTLTLLAGGYLSGERLADAQRRLADVSDLLGGAAARPRPGAVNPDTAADMRDVTARMPAEPSVWTDLYSGLPHTVRRYGAEQAAAPTAEAADPPATQAALLFDAAGAPPAEPASAPAPAQQAAGPTQRRMQQEAAVDFAVREQANIAAQTLARNALNENRARAGRDQPPADAAKSEPAPPDTPRPDASKPDGTKPDTPTPANPAPPPDLPSRLAPPPPPAQPAAAPAAPPAPASAPAPGSPRAEPAERSQPSATEAAPGRPPSSAQSAASATLRAAVGADRGSLSASPAAPPAPTTGDSAADFDQEIDLQLPRAPLAEEVVVSDFRPLWRTSVDGPELLLLRTVQLDGAEMTQGVWMDWPAMRGWLLGAVGDLVPGADLRPVEPGPAADPGRALAAIPAMLHPPTGFEAAAPSLGWTPLRLGLAGMWTVALIAAGATSLALRASLALAERRGRFVSAVTHELRTPLTTFCLYSQMLADGMVTEEPQRAEYLGTLKREAGRLAGIVENVLEYARLSRPRRALVADMDLADALAARVDSLRQRAGACGLALTLHNDAPAGARVRAEADALDRILANLVENACKYAPGSGELVLHAAADGPRVHIDLTDRGPGIPPADRERIFIPFERGRAHADGPTPGIGLGLPIARALAEKLGGSLQAIDPPTPPGARLRLTLRRVSG